MFAWEISKSHEANSMGRNIISKLWNGLPILIGLLVAGGFFVKDVWIKYQSKDLKIENKMFLFPKYILSRVSFIVYYV